MNSKIKAAYIAAGEAAVIAGDAADALNTAETAVSAAKRVVKAARNEATDAAARSIIAMEKAEDVILDLN